MSEFKFSCPRCKQRIQGAKDWVGRQITCPTCKEQFAVPAPAAPAGAKKSTRPISNVVSDAPSLAPAAPEIKPAAAEMKPAAREMKPVAAEIKAAAAEVKPAASDSAPTSTRVAVLTPAIKLDIIRKVKQMISARANWLPGVSKTGELIYAAKVKGGKSVPTDPTSPEATRFSLMGAVLRELANRDTARNASGRRKLLDEEIPAAMKKVMEVEEGIEPARELSDKEALSINHEQCLEALEILEEQYRTKKVQASAEDASKKLGDVRLSHLVKKIDKKLRIFPEDIVTALFHEIRELQERLEKVEKNQKSQGGQRPSAE